METIGKKEENMKSPAWSRGKHRSPKENPDNKKEYEIIEEKKLARDIKKQCANDKQLPKVAITKQNVTTTNIATTPKEKTTARWHISERRLGTTEQIQSKYNKEKAQKV